MAQNDTSTSDSASTGEIDSKTLYLGEDPEQAMLLKGLLDGEFPASLLLGG